MKKGVRAGEADYGICFGAEEAGPQISAQRCFA
jgi:hypothetical protein